ncbi:39S mitochondrial ribosomal protein L46-domain-containing protein [Hygrophoropsis aurantiaca]|uniref:39S mitochondrial ribosomal protein L46-domain-containing protein n=1 Tax=Hygrophoropsis aurantiaca TaxID=72124 RepID=A0ACB8A749_9AGAM|nr:39S mitochondrial ribosomal protein L46-domain-containing protein [Hygrophoropsis aurantiaca]
MVCQLLGCQYLQALALDMFSRTALSQSTKASNANIRRFLATEVDATSTSNLGSNEISRVKKAEGPILHTSIILNRSPIITRTPTSFERAYYAYQARIHRALHNPFPYEFYFKQGSPLESRFNLEERRRERKAFGAPFGLDSSEKNAATELAESSLRDEEEETMPRIHEADVKGDLKNLNRRSQRNIYLLLLQKENGRNVWRFPQVTAEKGELLHIAAMKGLDVECGNHMDSWIVSRNPIGAFHPPVSEAATGTSQKDVVFFYKAHIMAGQVRPDRTHTQDFAWLTKGEIGTRVDKNYWLCIKDMLSDF